jgi:hypothetical protein
MNCEKGESHCLLHTTPPCTIQNLLSLQNQPDVSKPYQDVICNQISNDCMIIEGEMCY